MELTRSGFLGTVIVLLVVAGCIRLGFWQLDRRDQRLTHNAAIAERLDASPVDLVSAPADSVGLVHRAATVAGRYDHDRTFVLMGRSYGGAPGVYVFTPLRLSDGAMLVNRGWVPASDAATVDLSMLDRPAEATVSGVLLPFPDVRDPGADGSFRQRWFRLDGEAIRAQYPYPVAPVYLLDTAGADRSSPATASLTPVPLDSPGLEAGPHLSYAVQWFSFATIFLLGWVVMLVRRAGHEPRARAPRG